MEVSRLSVETRCVCGSIFSSSRCERKLKAKMRELICAGMVTCKESGPLVKGNAAWCERRNQLHALRIPHKLQSYSSQPENRKYLPSAVQFPPDWRVGCSFFERIACRPLPSTVISQIDCVPNSPRSSVKRMVLPSGDQAGERGWPST